MTSLEKFSLRWNDFQENTTSAFGNLRDDKQFTDVTLVSEDGQQLEAHKVILSASSPFFMNILKLNKHPNPLVYLKGFKAKELHSLIDFMHHGVADIYQDDLDIFLAKAEELQLKGLTGGGKERKQQQEGKLQNHMVHKLKPEGEGLSFHRDLKEEYHTEILDDNDYNSPSTTTVVAPSNPRTNVSFIGGSAEDLKSTIWSMITQDGKVLTCTICGKTTDRSLNRRAKEYIERHVESVHVDGVTYDCAKCDKTCRSRRTLSQHVQQVHDRQ